MATQPVSMLTPPLTDAIAAAVSRLVDDHGVPPREPSHSMLESVIDRTGLGGVDPGRERGRPIGKEKRVRAVLNSCLSNDPTPGGHFVARLIAEIKGCGGFRLASSNYVGASTIEDAQAVFLGEGWVLATDGDLAPRILESLEGVATTAALRSYVRRIRQGYGDSALVVGTGKDLLEATAAHVILERFGGYNARADFPTLLGQAFVAVGLATPADRIESNEHPRRGIQRSLYELGCSVNRLRNKEGAGHGRPFLPSLTDDEARQAAEAMALVSEALLNGLT